MKMLKIIKKTSINSYLWFGLILIFAFWVRTYQLDRPIADWHSWRQADTAAVSRNFVKDGFTILTPRFDDMSPLSEEELPNPQRYRYVEFPLYNVLVGLVWVSFPYYEFLARLISIFFSLGSIVFLFLISRRYLGEVVALVAAFIFAFLPYNIFYSTVILPEPLLIFSILGTIFFFDLWLERNRSFWADSFLGILAILFSVVAILVKPTAAFMALPLFYLAYRHLGFSLFKSPKIWLFLFLTLIPFFLWRLLILQHPEGIPRFRWLLNGDGIRFKGAFFYWIIQDRLNRLILGAGGFSLFILGLLHITKREGLFFFSWLLGMVLYVVVFATGSVTHDYYQVPLIPILAVFVAKGIAFLFSQNDRLLRKALGSFLAIFLALLMFGLTWKEVKPLFSINNPKIVEVGRLADRLLPKDAKVIAPYGGDTAFLYQTNRPGWAISYLPVEEMRKIGATHYVTVNLNSEAKDIMGEYKTIVLTDEYAIVDLTQKKSS